MDEMTKPIRICAATVASMRCETERSVRSYSADEASPTRSTRERASRKGVGSRPVFTGRISTTTLIAVKAVELSCEL
jgi:hypothetical protein